MVFSSVTFLFYFLPVFLLAYVLLPFRNATALLFSVLFYLWGEGIFIAILVVSIALNYLAGRHIDAAPSQEARKRALAMGVGANLLILIYFKYFGFLTLGVLGLTFITPDHVPHLPLGISFFTFQSISYLIDVYRGHAPVAKRVSNLALYIMMFPQLIAGPIVRYASVAEQLRRRTISLNFVRHGLWLFVAGLGQKVLLADQMAVTADRIYGMPVAELTTLAAWLGTLAYTLQIFFDFAGYSNMAIGLGFILGFRFPLNFNYPYVARSITDFWRRWHMSLSSWFRDYVYIPAGGNRHGIWRTYRNLVLVFVLCGLWHGAAWTFLLWGLYHGALLVLERLGLGRLLSSMPSPVRHLYLLLAVMLGWVLFRADNLQHAAILYGHLFGLLQSSGSTYAVGELFNSEQLLFGGLALLLATPVLRGTLGRLAIEPDPAQVALRREVSSGQHVAFAVCVLTLAGLCTLYVASGTYSPFLYFRF